MNFMDYYMNFAVGVVDSTKDRELTVSLIPADFPPGKARSLHVDGFVMSDVVDGDELARAILEAGRPVVVSEMVPPGMPEPTATLAGDHQTAMNSLLERLRLGGATSIAVITPPVDQMWARISAESATAWAATNGVPVTFVDLTGVPSAEELRQLVGELRSAHPDIDAIVCLPQGLGVGILSTLREFGYSVPQDMQLVSYSDSSTLEIVQPPISALDLRGYDAGTRSGELLIAIIESGEAPAQTIESFELIYRERASTRPLGT